MSLSANSQPSASGRSGRSGRFRSFWFKLLDLPDDDQVQRPINSQLVTVASPYISTPTSASQTHLLRYQYQLDQNQRFNSSGHLATNSQQLFEPPAQFTKSSLRNPYKTSDSHHQASTSRAGTGEQVRFEQSNQNSVYCVSSVNLSRLAFEEQQSGGGRASSAAVPLVGSVKLLPPEVPTPTQLTIATELPTATKFTTRPASFVDNPQRPIQMMPKKEFFNLESYDEYEGMALCAVVLTIMSMILIACTMPFSLFLCIKVVQEYERAVIFRLGRLVAGGERGPGIFFIIPCIDTYTKVDLRTVSFDVPPQEVS